MNFAKKTAKSFYEIGRSYMFHKEQNNEARRMLKLIESERGKLSNKNYKLCNEYALDIFKNKKYTPWLHTYCAWNNEFKEGWIPDNYYCEYIVIDLKGDYGKICDRGALISNIIEDDNSSNLGFFINHLLLDINNEIYDASSFKELIFKNTDKVVFKIENSLKGKGVFFFTKETFDFEKIKKLGNGIFQKFIIQNEFFHQFNSSAVGTIRLTSVSKDNGEIEVRAGYYRFGRTNDTHVKSSTQMRIPFDINSGEFYHLAFHPNSRSTKHLPDSAIEFSGLKIPFLSKCISKVKAFHAKIPYIRCIGWDLIIDDQNEVKIIELNGGHNAITFSEIIYGPCFTGLNWEGLQHK